jgi:hypothetical protein
MLKSEPVATVGRMKGLPVIRWERQDNGDWQGYSGEFVVATVVKDADADGEQWLWTITALKRPKGWRKPSGHRAGWLDARGAADEYWERWLAGAALRPDIERLARQSLPAEERRKRRKPKRAAPKVMSARLK